MMDIKIGKSWNKNQRVWYGNNRFSKENEQNIFAFDIRLKSYVFDLF